MKLCREGVPLVVIMTRRAETNFANPWCLIFLMNVLSWAGESDRFLELASGLRIDFLRPPVCAPAKVSRPSF